MPELTVFKPCYQPIGDCSMARTGSASALRIAMDKYLKKCGIQIKPGYEADNLTRAMPLITSTGSVASPPLYAKTFFPVW